MIQLYECKFKMELTDSWHIVIRPFDENIMDKRSFMSEELHILKSYIKSIKLYKGTIPAYLHQPIFGNLLFKDTLNECKCTCLCKKCK